jgi:hypothetical protein
MERILALAFWALWARRIPDRKARQNIFEWRKRGNLGSRESTNPSEQDGEDDGLRLAIGDQLVSEPRVRKP